MSRDKERRYCHSIRERERPAMTATQLHERNIL